MFDPTKSLIQLKVLWFVVLGLVSLAVISGVVIFLNSNIVFDFSYQGFNQAVTIFRVPIAILAIIIPSVALLASNHRSEQAKAQIISSNSQNVFANYYKHREEFEKYVDKNKTDLRNKVGDSLKLYSNVFPDAKNGCFEVSKDIWNDFDAMIDVYINKSEELVCVAKEDRSRVILDMKKSSDFFKQKISINNTMLPSANGVKFDCDGCSAYLPNGYIRALYSELKSICKVLELACSFDTDSNISLMAESIKEINISSLPESKYDEEIIDDRLSLAYILNQK